jgi:hypothetical protein
MFIVDSEQDGFRLVQTGGGDPAGSGRLQVPSLLIEKGRFYWGFCIWSEIPVRRDAGGATCCSADQLNLKLSRPLTVDSGSKKPSSFDKGFYLIN